jgi:hypothetical protein
LTLEQQAAFVEEAPEIFLPIPGGCAFLCPPSAEISHTSSE